MEYKVIRSRRKSISVEVRRNCSIVVRSPYGIPNTEIRRFVADKTDWIEKALVKVRTRKEETESLEPYTFDELNELADKAVEILPQKVNYYAEKLGVTYGKISIKNQKSLWGSCSEKGNLNFNCLIMLAPDEVIDYLVVHELCHRKEMNHSKEFWKLVQSVLPDYKARNNWLKTEGVQIMRRNRVR